MIIINKIAITIFLDIIIYIYNDINDFNETIKDILENYDIYYDKIYGNFDENLYYDYIKENINKILERCVF